MGARVHSCWRVKVFAPQLKRTTIAAKTSRRLLTRNVRSESGMTRFCALLCMKCSSMADKMLRPVLLYTEVCRILVR
jgi:hypothetical protein